MNKGAYYSTHDKSDARSAKIDHVGILIYLRNKKIEYSMFLTVTA